MTLDNSGSGATISVSDGSHVIDAPLVFNDNVTVSNSGRLAFSSSSSITETNGSRSLTLTGPGTLILSGSDTYRGGTTVTPAAR